MWEGGGGGMVVVVMMVVVGARHSTKPKDISKDVRPSRQAEIRSETRTENIIMLQAEG
jgi:hypothetical protein